MVQILQVKKIFLYIFFTIFYFLFVVGVEAATVGGVCSAGAANECCVNDVCQCQFVYYEYGYRWVVINDCSWGCSSASCNSDPNTYGVCGSANGSAMVSLSPSSANLCDGHCGSIYLEDIFGSDGTFNWRCQGLLYPESTCASLGSKYTVRCSSTKVTCVKDSDCGSCKKCAKDGTVDSYCYSYTNSGIDGKCGTANGGSFCSYPSNYKCSTTYGVTAIDNVGNDGNFNWKCEGQAAGTCRTVGADATCTATKLATVTGVCGSSETGSSCTAPTSSLCTSGTASSVTTNSTTFTWTCTGSCGGGNDSCVKTRSIVNGQCGSSDGSCVEGTAVDSGASNTVANDGIYSLWSCNSTCNGTNASCSYKTCSSVNGVCGTADGGNFVSTPTTNLCSVGTASAVTLSGTTYSWSCNASCNGTTDYCSAVYDTAPSLSSTVLKNTSGTVIATEVGGRNHSCDANFSSKTNVWTITGSDANGLADIKETSLRFRSVANTYSYGPVAAVNGVASFTIDTTSFTPGTYNVETLINDIHDPPLNRDWIDTNRDFKIWDCQVDVAGTIYDSSGQSFTCSNSGDVGFINEISAGLNFGLNYVNAVETKTMTVDSPNFSSGANTLTWQNTYGVAFGDNFPGVLNASKIGETCIFPWSSQFSLSNYVSPYSANPSINIKYSAVMDQEAWFRVKKGSVIAETSVDNLVAITCTTNCKTTTDGLVWSKDINLTTGLDNSKQITSQPQPPRRNYYSTLKYDIHGGEGIGTTYPDFESGSDLWSEKIGEVSPNGIIFVDGDLIIDRDVEPSNYSFVIVSGSINILENVEAISRTILYAENQIVASGQSNNQLVINGALYGKKAVILNRSYIDKGDNNDSPAIEIDYNPNLIFRLPKPLWVTMENWRLE